METVKEIRPPVQDLVTIDDYAIIIGKTSRTVYNLISDKKIKTWDFFGKTLINKFDRPED